MSEERLQKFLARAGVASRRKAEELISAGRVTVNGKRAELGMKVTEHDDVQVDGEAVLATQRNVTYALYKPPGVVTTVKDEKGRRTVMEFFEPIPGLHPVGRLDYESEGLLLMTTDGDLTLQLTHPRYGHEKEYRVWCKGGAVKNEDLKRLEAGIRLEDGVARAIRAQSAEGGCILVLEEGRNRQVRRMLGALGYDVTRLKRTRIGGLELGHLKPGSKRKLSHDDLVKLGYTRE